MRFLLQDARFACRYYSYLSVCTGSSRAARFAGIVPKSTPTNTDVVNAATADHGLTGILNGDNKPSVRGMARPRIVPIIPPLSERKTASVRNCNRISRLVAPRALRIPISLILD